MINIKPNQRIFKAPEIDNDPIPGLRGYQSGIYKTDRQLLQAGFRSIANLSATGSGKTPLASAISSSVYGKNKRVWFIVPRNALLDQASNHFTKWNVPHGRIHAKFQESRAYKVHVISKDTLIRRLDKIKNWPDIIIFDECHLYIDAQLKIISFAPIHTVIIGLSATMERLDGRGLWTGAGGPYEVMVKGPEIPWLVDRDFLSPLKYFAPPLDGLADLRTRGNEIDEEQLEELLKRRKVYGEVVGHYEEHGRGKPALGFCRSVKSAYEMAERFRDKGYNFHCIEGKMASEKLKALLNAHRNGEIDGLTTCDLVLYGVDIPRVEYGFSVRPTLSRAIYMQMIGRLLRPFFDEKTGYRKEQAFWFDHVNMVTEHQDDKYPDTPLHYCPEISWNFEGVKKRKRNKEPKNIKLCEHLDHFYCDNPVCGNCRHNPDKTVKDCRKPMLVIESDLKEISRPVKLADRPIEERQEFQDRIGGAVMEYRQSLEVSSGPECDEIERLYNMGMEAVKKLLDIAQECGYSPLWVYNRLTADDRKTINWPVLHLIQRIKGYKKGWLYFIQKQIEGKNRRAG